MKITCPDCGTEFDVREGFEIVFCPKCCKTVTPENSSLPAAEQSVTLERIENTVAVEAQDADSIIEFEVPEENTELTQTDYGYDSYDEEEEEEKSPVGVKRILLVLGIIAAVAAVTVAVTVAVKFVKNRAVKPETPSAIAVETVTMSETQLTLELNTAHTLTCSILPENATDKAIVWESDNTAVAVVTDGVVTAVGKGECTISAKCSSGLAAQCSILVTIPVKEIKLSESAIKLEEGATTELTASVSPENADAAELTWSSSDTSVASVSGGKITAAAAGNCVITAKTANGVKAECSVEVTKPYEILLLSGTWTGSEIEGVGGLTLNASNMSAVFNDDGTGTLNLLLTSYDFTWKYSGKTGEQYRYTLTLKLGTENIVYVTDNQMSMVVDLGILSDHTVYFEKDS